MSKEQDTKFAELDSRDLGLVAKRMGEFLAVEGPKVGDYVKFADGAERRISYIWRDEHDVAFSIQTSEGGSWYFGNGYCSFSGSLHSGVKPETLKHTGSIRTGSCWFFHHDHHCAHNGVTIYPPIFDEWTSSEEAPR